MRLDVPSDSNWDRLPHFFAGELSDAAAAELLQWIDTDVDRHDQVARLWEVWALTANAPHAWNADTALHRVYAESATPGHAITQRSGTEQARVIARIGVPSRRTSSWRIAISVVAVMLVIAVDGATVWRMRRTGTPALTAPVVSGNAATYTANRGQRLSVRLGDGTLVTLAAGSRLRKPADYGVVTRTLFLEGEAYFDVTHDTARPFTVRTARTVARDLGTRFVVRAYPDATPTEVVVMQGKVMVDSFTLVRGQRARVEANGRVSFTANVDVDRYLAWTEGQLIFRDTPLRDVMTQLARWYDVDVQLADPALAERPLTATFSQHEPIAEVFRKIAEPLGVTIVRTSSRYTIHAH